MIDFYILIIFALVAEETIGWLRIVRPGSVIGPQQQYMKDMQARLWREGDMMRTRLGNTLGTLGGEVDDVSSSMGAMSMDDKLSGRSGGNGVITGSSSKPSRRGNTGSEDVSDGKEEDGEVTQGDVLRQRRMHNHHMTPAEAKASGVTTTAAGASSKAVSAKASAATTRSHIGRLLGR